MVFFIKLCQFLKLEFIKSEDVKDKKLISTFHVWETPQEVRRKAQKGDGHFIKK